MRCTRNGCFNLPDPAIRLGFLQNGSPIVHACYVSLPAACRSQAYHESTSLLGIIQLITGVSANTYSRDGKSLLMADGLLLGLLYRLPQVNFGITSTFLSTYTFILWIYSKIINLHYLHYTRLQNSVILILNQHQHAGRPGIARGGVVVPQGELHPLSQHTLPSLCFILKSH